MNVFEFEKSLLERFQESEAVLRCKNTPVPASEVRCEWAYHIELQIEPAGWQAMWKMSRVTCEEFSIKHPTVVHGTVTNVLFQDLKAVFTITAVQDDDVHLPEVHEVPLEDLWPTIDQENPELNIEATADCIDQLRFFYRNVWMPWNNDNDEDLDWAEKRLESRIKFCFDLKRNMSRPMADHIRVLLAEARYIQSRRELIEVEMSDDEEEMNESMDRRSVTDLMRLHLRLAVIRNEIELLENPEMRQIYEEINFKGKSLRTLGSDMKPLNFVVTKDDTIENQIEYFKAVQPYIKSNKAVKVVSSLKECMKSCAAWDRIYVTAGRHLTNFLEALNSQGSITGIYTTSDRIASLPEKLKSPQGTLDERKYAIISSEEDDSTLMAFDGNYTLDSVLLDCRNVRLGLWCRFGAITLKNCTIVGDNRSSTRLGIVIGNGATCILENTVMQSFATGITCLKGGKLIIKNSIITECRSGLDMNEESVVETESARIESCSESGIVFTGNNLIMPSEAHKHISSSVSEFNSILSDNRLSTTLAGGITFADNKKGNIVVFNRERDVVLQNSAFIEDSLIGPEEENSVESKHSL